MRTFTLAMALTALSLPALADPLPSWNDTDAKARIIDFVETVTDPASDQYVTPDDRIATFDNDGTLWSEQPLYFQVIFAIDMIAEMAAADPSILTSDALKAAAAKDYRGVVAGGRDALGEVVAVSHSGMTVPEFQARVSDWLETARHPMTGQSYDEMTYQPMVELLSYLRDEGFKTYIVSGGGVHFMRAFAEEAYGIPPEQVIGTLTKSEYSAGKITKTPGFVVINDGELKALNIDRIIGKRPILAGGNSDGDFAMLEYTTAGDGPRLGLIVHHTDDAREVAYDRESHVGTLKDGLDKGPDLGWLIVDMKEDWARVHTGQ